MNNQTRRRQYQPTLQNPGIENTSRDEVPNLELKKNQLIARLNQVIDKIGNAKNVPNCIEDSVILTLEKIQEEAKAYDFKEIAKMASLAIGKRILNIQLEKKRTEIENKLEKKRQIEEYFRENRIKKLKYDQIALQKLKQNIFIVKPYKDGKAFIESTIFYDKVVSFTTGQSYEQYFDECNYKETVKHINRIFFKNYSNSSSEHSRRQAINNPILRTGFLILLTLLSLCITLSITSYGPVVYALFILNLLMMVLMAGLCLHSYCYVKLRNNQLEETIMEITAYFTELNQANKKLGNRFQWRCPPQFLYLEVKFDRDAPEESQINLNK